MAVQQNKVSRSKRNKRRFHDKVKGPELSVDPTTGETHMRHHITDKGFYRGKKVIEIVEKESKAEEIAAAEES